MVLSFNNGIDHSKEQVEDLTKLINSMLGIINFEENLCSEEIDEDQINDIGQISFID